MTNAIAVAAGTAHGIVLLADGSVLGFGNNHHGQAFAGEGQVIGWRAVSNSAALRFESSYIQQGTGVVRLEGQPLTGVTSVAAALNHSLALKGDGTVVGWGTRNNGELFRVPTTISNIVALACGGDTDYFLHKDGYLLGYGENGTFTVPGVSNFVVLSATKKPGSEFVAAQKDGAVWMGSASRSARMLVSPAGKTKAVAGGASHALALREDGTVIGIGEETPGDFT
ncbi:MAG TPA: hypothetical protein VN673_17820, partial [Clostridia bacterium]|nr:hypothetical protein [Clostridia bacterium]